MRRWAVLAALLLACASASYAGVLVKRSKRWPLPANRRIPVYVDRSLSLNPGDLTACRSDFDRFCRIRIAIREWNVSGVGVVEFEEVAEPPVGRDHVYIRPATSSEAKANTTAAAHTKLGYQGAGQHEIVIFVLKPLSNFERTVQHELGHVVGLDHEHQHRDRERYIKFAVDRGANESYRIETDDRRDFFGPYDFRSIMHYGAATGWTAVNDGPKQLQQQRLTADEVGYVSGLSSGDWRALRFLYCDLPQDCPLFTPVENAITDTPVEALFPKPPKTPRTEMRRR